MNKLYLVLYYVLILGSYFLATVLSIDLSVLWMLGVIIVLYIYLLPDLFRKKKLDIKKMSFSHLVIYLLPLLINCILVILFH